jgi:hypothetical protein
MTEIIENNNSIIKYIEEKNNIYPLNKIYQYNFDVDFDIDFLEYLFFLQKENLNYFINMKSITLNNNEINNIKKKLKKIVDIFLKPFDLRKNDFPSFNPREIYNIIYYLIEKESAIFIKNRNIKKGFYISCDKIGWSILSKYLASNHKLELDIKIFDSNFSEKESAYLQIDDMKVFFLKDIDIFSIYRNIIIRGKKLHHDLPRNM